MCWGGSSSGSTAPWADRAFRGHGRCQGPDWLAVVDQGPVFGAGCASLNCGDHLGRVLVRLLHRQLWTRNCGKGCADLRVGGRAQPTFTDCCPGAIKKPNLVPWSKYLKQFEFVTALRPTVNGTTNRARFDHWLPTFGYLRSGGQISCLLANYTVANKAAMRIARPAQRREALRRTVVLVR